jgi:hypothetical protein
MIGGSLLIAGLSVLLLPRVIAYDPWSWLVWGRQIDHLALNTRSSATSVKPLAIYIDTLLAPAGSSAFALWLLVARTATLLSFALVFKVAWRLGGWLAGAVAVVGLAISDQYLGYLFMQGMSEPMATAAVLAAVDNHLDSRRGWTLGCLIAAALLRPEAWPLLALYLFWLVYRGPVWKWAVAALLAVGVPVSWFVIDWFGARQLNRSAVASSHQSQGGPLLAREPGLATLRESWHLTAPVVIVLFVLGFAVALWRWRRDGEARPTVWLGFLAIGWLIVDALLAQRRVASGAERYLLPGAAIACVVAGVFVADVVRGIRSRRSNGYVPAIALAVGGILLVLLALPRTVDTVRQVRNGVHITRQESRLTSGLDHAIALAGGRDAILQCGTVSTEDFQVPIVAWHLQIPVDRLTATPGESGVVLREAGAPRVPAALASRYRVVGTVGASDARWTVLSTCPVSAAATGTPSS